MAKKSTQNKPKNVADTYKVELTQEQLNNLNTFLSRTQLRGDETPAFNDIVRAIQSASTEQVGDNPDTE